MAAPILSDLPARAKSRSEGLHQVVNQHRLSAAPRVLVWDGDAGKA
jgi:hypothetical protein